MVDEDVAEIVIVNSTNLKVTPTVATQCCFGTINQLAVPDMIGA